MILDPISNKHKGCLNPYITQSLKLLHSYYNRQSPRKNGIWVKFVAYNLLYICTYITRIFFETTLCAMKVICIT